MRAMFLLVLLPLVANSQTKEASASTALVDREAGRPMVLALDVDPGYYKQVLMPVNEGEEEEEKTIRISISPPAEAEWTAGHWNPSVFLCLRPAETSKQSYCANLDIDRTESLHTFGTARLFSASGEVMFRKLTPALFQPKTKVELRVVRNGEHVTTSFDGITIDDGEVGFTPAFWIIGASTGVATIEVIEELEAPLGPGEWPTSIEAAVALELDYLSSSSKSMLREMRKEDLVNFRIGWGTQLVDRQGLSRGNRKLLEAACGEGCDAAVASMTIIEAVWTSLQEPAQ